MNAPNPAQHRAITTTAGPVLISAGPDFGGAGFSRLAVPVRPRAAGDMPVGWDLIRQTIISRPCRILVRQRLD